MGSAPESVSLSEMSPGDQGDCFALLASKDRATTRDGKPYYRCEFRDSHRVATAMIWQDSAWFKACDSTWQVGEFYKLRCRYDENKYGPQVELDKVRPVEEADREQGFDPRDFFESSRFPTDEMFDELLDIARTQIDDPSLTQLVVEVLTDHQEDFQTIPAASRNHHAFASGLLEHVLSVTKTCIYLADKYGQYYTNMQPELSKSLIVAGAILHDIGKLVELRNEPQGAVYTAHGRLIGHILIGRDMVREKAASIDNFDPETLLRLEHIIVAHQNLPEWGSPIAPHTPEALLVHYADDIDAKFHMMATSLEEEAQGDEEFTGRDNGLRRPIFRGLLPRNQSETNGE